MDEAVLVNVSAHTIDLFNFEKVDADFRDALVALVKVDACVCLLCNTKKPSDFDDFRPILWAHLSAAVSFAEPLYQHVERIRKWLPTDKVITTPVSAPNACDLILQFVAECRFCVELFGERRETFPANASDAGVLYDHLNFCGLPNLLAEVRTYVLNEIGEARRQYIAELRLMNSVPKGREKPAANSASETEHSDDFSSVRWFGVEYVFTPNQAAAVKVLWTAWERGRKCVSFVEIQDEAVIDAEKLSKVFVIKRGGKQCQHDAWGTMIIPVDGMKSRYSLSRPKITPKVGP